MFWLRLSRLTRFSAQTAWNSWGGHILFMLNVILHVFSLFEGRTYSSPTPCISHFLFHLLTIQPHHQNSLVSLTYDWCWNVNAIRTHQNVKQPCSTKFPCNSSVNTFFLRFQNPVYQLVFQSHNETVRFKIYQSWTLEVPTLRPHSLQRWCSMRSSRTNSWTCHRIRLPISNHDFVVLFLTLSK